MSIFASGYQMILLKINKTFFRYMKQNFIYAAGFSDTENLFQESNLQRPTNLKLQMEQWGEHTDTLEVRFGKISALQKCKFIRDIAGYFPNVPNCFFKLTIYSPLFIRFRRSKICDGKVSPSGLPRKPPRFPPRSPSFVCHVSNAEISRNSE